MNQKSPKNMDLIVDICCGDYSYGGSNIWMADDRERGKNGPKGGLDRSNPCLRPPNTSQSRNLSVHTQRREKKHFVEDRK